MQIHSHNPMPNTLQAPLFQEEKPVWYTINCNPLPKDYKQPKMEDDVVHEHDIAMRYTVFE
ncbi:hypothetical protein HanXRQr2_Chr03g0095941 [Helianthus annuus]|uniref:Uncharacterized protein n=1 Tax=Helianthus annuus TaxID=4232 RepID=A0A9K3JE26_HELAN|nr:hypothetical protein HanXRQr2_Chr03g0095941 [Helianthus annuus]KAJ0942492.1 hypothetical protein HanPSC8_Chr03g0092561 [Helianthus annuus]